MSMVLGRIAASIMMNAASLTANFVPLDGTHEVPQANVEMSCPVVLEGDDALRARYAKPSSQWVLVDCEPIHFVEEGVGPAILLLHGSYASLREWDVMGAALAPKYRVVRIDMPPAGLSGPNPSGDYSPERQIRIIDAVLDHLGVERVLVVGTSSGGVPAAAFAAERPEKVTGLVLSNIAVAAIRPDPAHFPEELKAAIMEDARDPGRHTTAFWRAVIRYNFFKPGKVQPDLVEEWTKLNDRALRMPVQPQKALSDFDRVRSDLPRIVVPTLLLWSAEDRELTFEEHGRRALELSGSPDKQFLIVPNCGHLLPLECPDAALTIALPFLDRVAR